MSEAFRIQTSKFVSHLFYSSRSKSAKALASSSNCLEELILRGNNTYDQDQDEDGKLRLGPLGSLTEFERLRYVIWSSQVP